MGVLKKVPELEVQKIPKEEKKQRNQVLEVAFKN